MATLYATTDMNDRGDAIAEAAWIAAFTTRAAAEEYLRESVTLEDDETLVIEAGKFGDCWLKMNIEPEEIDLEPFASDDLIIQGPGSHPGMNKYWITPRPEVLVARVERA
jgi:hypothetical protein